MDISTSINDIIPNLSKAIALARREISVLVYEAVQLEGINMTLPEIQTLLEGVTVGGHKISDQQIALNQGDAWKALFDDVVGNKFSLSSRYALFLHGIAGKEEALELGCFRSGGVKIAGTDYLPPAFLELPVLFDEVVARAEKIADIVDRAIFIFLVMARTQFFYDVNKRMGRFMMNGVLLSHGYPVINVPVKRKLEFNELMLDFYSSNKQGPMNQFLRSCIDERIVKIMSEPAR